MASAAEAEVRVCGIKMVPVVSQTGSYSTRLEFDGKYTLSVGPINIELGPENWAQTFAASVQAHRMVRMTNGLTDIFAAANWASKTLAEMMAESDNAIAKIREWSGSEERKL